MPERLDAVCSAVYLVFNEGYAATAGDGLVRAELCEEAIRLGRLLVARMPDEPEVRGLLAAMLVHDARRRTRVDADGEPVLLDRQDRALWDHAQIEEGCGLIADALRQGPPGPYAVQAAIAALHGEASSGATTDWPQIAALYDVLYSLRRTPVVALNRAVAVAMAFGPTHGLAEMAGLEASLGEYHLYHASRADLLRRVGQPDAAADAYRAALRCVTNDSERRFLRRQLEQVLDGRGASPGAAQTNGPQRPEIA
jgi:RNA polymerase sigma-70 factor (ECF subfamily)